MPCLGPTNSVVAVCFSSFEKENERIVNVRSEEEAIVLHPNPFIPVQLYETASLQMVEGHLAHVCTVTFLEEGAPRKKEKKQLDQ